MAHTDQGNRRGYLRAGHGTAGHKAGKNLLGTFIADLVLQILSFVAESERNSIRKRQAEGIVAAKERGVRFGRPLLLLPENFENAAEAWNEKRISLQQAAKLCRMSVSTFYRKAKAVRKCNETVS